jgi:diguanylate cyclase (GGDEF)-like protein
VSGVPIVGPDGTLLGYRGVSRDITERKLAEEQLEREAHYDRVTGLPNRALCFDRLKQVIAATLRHRNFAGVMLLDLDRFKNINDTLGHAIGDAVLRATAQRLAACLRTGDTVARIGGDEFVILLQDLQQAQDAALVAKKVLHALQQPIVEGGHEVFATASIGIAICPPDGQKAETLLANADAALSGAKKAGRATFQFYTAEMNARAADQLALERDLRRALERRELSLHYQPKVHIMGNRIVGFEALLRWTRGGSPVSPGVFIPVLEESGFIREVGAWVLDEACRQIAAWRAAGLGPLPVAINVSAKQLNADLQPLVERALLDHGVEARLLRIEITESDAMVDPERALAVLRGLKDIGIALSIDDFGTGYSSLSYLKRFQPSELKLDRSFVSGLPDNVDDVSITKAVISMAHSLGMKVVAEGVETDAQRAFLQSRGCDQMQGYLFSRPVSADQARAFLRPAEAARVG